MSVGKKFENPDISAHIEKPTNTSLKRDEKVN